VTVLEFFYDESGRPVQMSYNGQVFNYVLNLQGDVQEIRDPHTGEVVATYVYNAWGQLLYSSGWMADVNPIRYRGYFYDTATGLYYLQSRYYDPVIGRFLNVDEFMSTGQSLLGFNMFVYCLNNPVNAIDPDGRRAIFTCCTYCAENAVMPTQAQQNAGVVPIQHNGQWMLDFSVPIRNALDATIPDHLLVFHIPRPFWFYHQVNHEAPWDIKIPDMWNNTIGAYTFPGPYAVVHFEGFAMTPEQLGNFTYGYIGTAEGFPRKILFMGSVFAAYTVNVLGTQAQIADELMDWFFINQGVNHFWGW